MRNYDNYSPEINYPEERETPESANEPSRAQGKKKSDKPSKKKEPVRKKDTENSNGFLKKAKAALTGTTARLLTGIFIGCLAVYLGVAFFSYFGNCIKDQALINASGIGAAGHVNNAGGEGGARLAEFLINECFGLGSFVIVFWLAAMTLKLLVAVRNSSRSISPSSVLWR